MTITGAIFCGGQSSRMGRDKASLELAGKSMVQWVAAAMSAAGIDRIYKLGGQTHSGLPSIADSRPEAGPLSALIGAVETFGDVFVCPCDVPLISEDLIRRIINAGSETERAVVLAQSDYLQPLIGLYKEDAAVMLRNGYEQGARGPKYLLTAENFETAQACEHEVQNVNTPEELQRVVDFLNASSS